MAQTQFVSAQQELPAACYRDGNLDLSTCSVLPWDIPQELFQQGYFGVHGYWVPRLPNSSMHTLDLGTHLTGNITYMRRGIMYGTMLDHATAWGLDPSLFVGGIAIDSCRYEGSIAWIRRNGSSEEWVGPLLVVDCAALPHKYERACYSGTVGELGYEVFELFPRTGKIRQH